MKSLLATITLVLLILTQTAKAQVSVENFPSTENVYTVLNRQLKSSCKECTIKLAKKLDGYYVEFIRYDDVRSDHVEYSKIWDAATNKYLAVDFGKHLEAYDPTLTSYRSKGHEAIRQKEKESDFNYIYGYPDYTKDLIAYLENKTDLKSNELEMLARAYSNEASNFIHPNISGTIISASKNLPVPDYSKVSPERIKSFQELAEKSIACYKKIKAINPDYKPLIIESVGLKLNNDLMHYYLTMKLVKEPELAQVFFDQITFTDSEIEIAKNTLNNCKTGGIIFVTGDNDTFSLLYVQDKFNFRKDLSVINYSLLQTSWYFDYIIQTFPVKTTLTLEKFKALSKVIVRTSKKSASAPSFSKWMEEINTSLRFGKLNDETNNYSETYETVSILRNNKQITLTSENGYLTAAEIVVLDIISSNQNNAVYVTHPEVLEEFKTVGQFAFRDVLFEFTGSEESNYFDGESLETLKKDLDNPIFSYPTNADPIENWLYESWCLNMIYLSYFDPSAFKELYPKFKQKVDESTVVKNDNDIILDGYKSVLEASSTKDLDHFLRAYAPVANKKIAEIQTIKVTTGEDVETLYEIQQLYAPKTEVSTNGKAPLTTIQKEILKEIRSKVKLLMENRMNEKTLNWTYELLQRDNNAFEQLEM